MDASTSIPPEHGSGRPPCRPPPRVWAAWPQSTTICVVISAHPGLLIGSVTALYRGNDDPGVCWISLTRTFIEALRAARYHRPASQETYPWQIRPDQAMRVAEAARTRKILRRPGGRTSRNRLALPIATAGLGTPRAGSSSEGAATHNRERPGGFREMKSPGMRSVGSVAITAGNDDKRSCTFVLRFFLLGHEPDK
jgi:hypothetical protein